MRNVMLETIILFNFAYVWVQKDCMNFAYKNMEAQHNNQST